MGSASLAVGAALRYAVRCMFLSGGREMEMTSEGPGRGAAAGSEEAAGGRQGFLEIRVGGLLRSWTACEQGERGDLRREAW